MFNYYLTGTVATELANSITENEAAKSINDSYEQYARSTRLLAQAGAFTISQREDVDINEIIFQPTNQLC